MVNLWKPLTGNGAVRWVAMIVSVTVLAGESDRQSSSDPEDTWVEEMDHAHDVASDVIEGAVRRIDLGLLYLMATDDDRRRKRFEEESGAEDSGSVSRGSVVRVAPRVEIARFGSPEIGVDFSARIDLPEARQRVQLIIDSVDREDLPFEGLDRFRAREDSDRDDSAAAFLRLKAIEELLFSLDLDVGMSFRPEPIPRLRARALRWWKFEPWHLGVIQEGFWRSDDGFGQRSSLEVRRLLDEVSFLRFRSALLLSEVSQGWEYGQRISFNQAFPNNHETVALEAGFFTESRPHLRMDRYLMSVPYRRSIGRDWLYLRLEPAVDFARTNGFAVNPRILFQIEVFFGYGSP